MLKENCATPMAISLRNVSKVFRKIRPFSRDVQEVWALKGISISVQAGEIYGLIGPNGSGKSTLIRILSTLMPADQGNVDIFDMPLPAQEVEIRKLLGRVSVDAAFYKSLSSRDNLLFTGFLYGCSKSVSEHRALELLSCLGLDVNRFDDPLETMSRGMQQKVSIARALLFNPPLLLLDEPTTGLDPRSKKNVQGFIEKRRREYNTTVFLTTHDMDEAELLCDRVGVLVRGTLVAEGTPCDLKANKSANDLNEVFLKLIEDEVE